MGEVIHQTQTICTTIKYRKPPKEWQIPNLNQSGRKAKATACQPTALWGVGGGDVHLNSSLSQGERR